MKTNYLYTISILLCSTLIFSCSKEVEPDVEIMDPPDPEPKLLLLHPIEGAIVDYCFFNLAWEDETKAAEYKVEISKNNRFTQVVLDTLISDTSFELTSPLEPGENYYWRVSTTDSDLTASNEFTVIDYVETLNGTYYNTLFTYESWALLGESVDTTYRRKVQIYSGDSLRSISYKSDDDYKTLNLEFSNVLNREYVEFTKDPYTPHYSDFLRYYYKEDSIWIHSSFTANGGGSEGNYYFNRN